MYINGVSNNVIKEFGLNLSRAAMIGKSLGINTRKGLKKGLSKKLHIAYEELKKEYKTGDPLKKVLKKTHEFLALTIRSNKGVRNLHGLPSRGQRTKTNAKTKRRVGIKNLGS